MKNIIKHSERLFQLLAIMGILLAFPSCGSDDDDDDMYSRVELKAQFSYEPDGISSFDEDARVLVITDQGVTTSAVTLSDSLGVDVRGLTFKTSVPADDQVWCLANCSSNRLAISVAPNRTTEARQTLVDITAWDGDRLVSTYTMMVVQTPKKEEVHKVLPLIRAFLIPNQISSVIDTAANVISVTMPAGTDATSLKPTIVLSAGATVEPNSEVEQDFKNNIIKYTVTGPDGTQNIYYVVVTVREAQSGGGTGGNTGNEDVKDFKLFDMVEVKGGTFTLGEEPSHGYLQKNAHKVTVSSFKMGRYAVTQREFLQVMGYNPAIQFTSSDLIPVNNVTWYEALEYCNKLSERNNLTPVYTINGPVYDSTGKVILDATSVTMNHNANGYRLPTNAEWEYAAKGGINHDPYQYSGSNDVNEVSWYRDNSMIGDSPAMHVVGQKKPNSLGIYDMSGNQAEWTTQWYEDVFYTSDADEVDPWGIPEPINSQKFVIVRGGSFSYYDTAGQVNWRNMVSAYAKTDTDMYGAGIWLDQLGFRVILPDK